MGEVQHLSTCAQGITEGGRISCHPRDSELEQHCGLNKNEMKDAFYDKNKLQASFCSF